MSEGHFRDLVSILDDLMAKHTDAEIAALPGLLFGLHVFSQESRIRGLRFATRPHREALPIERGRWGQGADGVGAVLPEAVSLSTTLPPKVHVVSRETAWTREAARSPGGRWGLTPRSPDHGKIRVLDVGCGQYVGKPVLMCRLPHARQGVTIRRIWAPRLAPVALHGTRRVSCIGCLGRRLEIEPARIEQLRGRASRHG